MSKCQRQSQIKKEIEEGKYSRIVFIFFVKKAKKIQYDDYFLEKDYTISLANKFFNISSDILNIMVSIFYDRPNDFLEFDKNSPEYEKIKIYISGMIEEKYNDGNGNVRRQLKIDDNGTVFLELLKPFIKTSYNFKIIKKHYPEIVLKDLPSISCDEVVEPLLEDMGLELF